MKWNAFQARDWDESGSLRLTRSQRTLSRSLKHWEVPSAKATLVARLSLHSPSLRCMSSCRKSISVPVLVCLALCRISSAGSKGLLKQLFGRNMALQAFRVSDSRVSF